VAPRTVELDAKRRGDPGSAQFRIAEWPFYLMTQATGRYAMEMDRALHRLDMDLASWRALMWLHERNPSGVSEIADGAVMKLSTMTRVIQRLEKRGLVKLARRETDARVTDVHITSEGEKTVARIRLVAARIFHLVFHDFDTKEVAHLNALLRRVLARLDFDPTG
jgi:MarR family transcriptional regulator, organic hydroperoxide resistance regulator